jgi:hypothetical protein
MGVDHNYNSSSAYSDGVAEGKYKSWWSGCEHYAGSGALERNRHIF